MSNLLCFAPVGPPPPLLLAALPPTGIEAYVRDMIEANDSRFFPLVTNSDEEEVYLLLAKQMSEQDGHDGRDGHDGHASTSSNSYEMAGLWTRSQTSNLRPN